MSKNPSCPKCGGRTVVRRVGPHSNPNWVYKCIATGCHKELPTPDDYPVETTGRTYPLGRMKEAPRA